MRRGMSTRRTPPPPPLLSAFVMAVAGAAGKALFATASATNGLHVYRRDALLTAVTDRPPGTGLLTVSNHKSVLDDPLLLGALLPWSLLTDPSRMRWGLCAVDICWQGRAAAAVLTAGKVLPIVRRGGLGQPELTRYAALLGRGDWLHVFPEGRVSQEGMTYARHGLGKMVVAAMEAAPPGSPPPLLLPIYHEGVERVMPQEAATHELLSVAPRLGQTAYVMVGEAVDLVPALARGAGCFAARAVAARALPPGAPLPDPPECMALYADVCTAASTALRLLRARLRATVAEEEGVDLGDPYEVS